VEKRSKKKRYVEEKITARVQRLFPFHENISRSEEGNDLFTVFCSIRSVPSTPTIGKYTLLLLQTEFKEQTQISVIFLKKNCGSTYHFKQK